MISLLLAAHRARLLLAEQAAGLCAAVEEGADLATLIALHRLVGDRIEALAMVEDQLPMVECGGDVAHRGADG